ncbi:MAG: DNA mismatch repair protein MutS [Bacteroidia bacterium]|nr:MAG: DNA mismatch repair protein MutS [Bacteroidia bacterium]
MEQKNLFMDKIMTQKKHTNLNKSNKETPLMRQYKSFKSQYPDAILLFRVGDFYETFEEDAKITSKVLGITLTKRANGSASEVDLAGFPYHALDNYLPKLVKAGYRVAICDQLEDPKFAKTIVKRGITELVTPGLHLNDKILDHQKNNFISSLVFDTSNNFGGLALLDISTGDFFVTEGNWQHLENILQSLQPGEILFSKTQKDWLEQQLSNQFYIYFLDEWHFNFQNGYQQLIHHFKTNSLKGFGVEELKFAITACAGLLHYLNETKHHQIQHITTIKRIDASEFVWLDKFTARNLELFRPNHENGKALIDILDHTQNPMGARLLRQWIAMPLKNITHIQQRLDIVEFFFNHPDLLEKTQSFIKWIGDVERLMSKSVSKRISPREVNVLKNALHHIQQLKQLLIVSQNPHLLNFSEQINPCDLLKEKIHHYLEEDAPSQIGKGKTIKPNVHPELDELRKIAYAGKDYLIQIQQREIQRTSIPSLKIAYNNVFGYYLEVTNAHKNKVPADWIRKQTLTNAERYITPELKEYEEKILGAEEKILQLETQLFDELLENINQYTAPILHNARIIAQLDVLTNFAKLAIQQHYTKPIINDSFSLYIKEGRHPVIEQQLPPNETYISNTVHLNPDDCQIMMITGPNMSGKSALLRQTALIAIMAQIGSFVPAEYAEIGLLDKIFTRVGATDNISSGESTFMVEMNETANILNNISNRSLVLLDEIGRGTATYDGISIAWAIAEYLHEHPYRPKTLFATHYHELNDMADRFPRINNFNVSVKEIDDKIIFLRKLKEGGSEHSFGIHVAKLAGMPQTVIQRAEEILKLLEQQHQMNVSETNTPSKSSKPQYVQLKLFHLEDERLNKIQAMLQSLNLNTITPIEALLKLNEIQKILTEK